MAAVRLYCVIVLVLLAADNRCFSAAAFGPDTGDVDYLEELSLEELMQIKVTSVTKVSQDLATSASAIQVVTADQIHRAGASNIPEALRSATNLFVAQQNGREWVISARGFSKDLGNKLLVMMDGRNLYTPMFSGVFWDRHDYIMDDIEQIEVISGPGGTIWGANAVNGVINIVSKKASQTQGLYKKVSAGSQLNSLVEVRYGGALSSDAHYRAYGKYLDQNEGLLSDGSASSDARDIGQAGFRFDASLNAGDSITIQGDAYSSHAMLEFGEESSTVGQNLLGRWTRQFDDEHKIELQAYFDKTVLNFPLDKTIVFDIEFAPEGLFKNTLQTFDLEFTHHFSFGDSQNIVWGVNYRRYDDDSQNASGLGFDPEDVVQELYSAFIQDEIEISKNKFYVILGSKLESNDYTGSDLEPTIRFRWHTTEDSIIWGAISQAVRIPSRIDADSRQPSPPFTVILTGSKEFKSEALTAYEIGYRSYISATLLTSLSFFYNQYDDIRSIGSTEGSVLPYVVENNLEGNTQGLELNLTWETTNWWQTTLGYTYLSTDIRVKPGAFDFNNGLSENADPKNQLYLNSSVNLTEKLAVDVALRWIDSVDINDAGQVAIIPDYTELSLNLGWYVNEHIELAITGQNLLHASHQEFGVPGPKQEEAVRNIFASAFFRF